MTAIDKSPLVSIGLPVFNGEKYLETVAKSLLGQTYQNIELVITDNASQDATEEICQKLAQSDSRVRYERLSVNIGANKNHNRVLERARGDYFMWTGHDDIWDLSYVEKCIEALRLNPDAVAAYSLTGFVDENGEWMKVMPGDSTNLQDTRAWKRFLRMHDLYDWIYPVYGVVRLDVIRDAGTMPLHPGGDKVIFARIALRGRLILVPEILFYRRRHSEGSTIAHPSMQDRYRWIKPTHADKRVWPHFEYLRLMIDAILRSPASLVQKSMCFVVMMRWCYKRRSEILSDFRLETK